MATTFYTQVDLMSGVPLDPDYRHTLTFASLAAQTNYFTSKISTTSNRFSLLSYQRYQRGSIKLQAPITLLDTVNYMRFINANYLNTDNHESKYIYCFITSIEYISDTVVKIDYKVDVLQTWMFDYTLNPCYVEREHANSDKLGENIVDEGLETGDYIAQDYENLDKWLSHSISTDGDIYLFGYYLTIATQAPDGGLGWYIMGSTPTTLYFNLSFTMAQLTNVINSFKNGATGNLDPIVAIYLIPSGWHDGTVTARVQAQYGTFVGKTFALSKDMQVGLGDFKTYDPVNLNSNFSYTAKNAKTLTYPYNYLLFESPDGSSTILKYENFKDLSEHIAFDGALTLFPFVQTMMSPKYYESYNDDTSSDGINTIRINPKYMLCCKLYPTCGVASDAFQGWWAQNKYSMPVVDAAQQAASGNGYTSQLGMGVGLGQQLSDTLVRLTGGFGETVRNMLQSSTGDIKVTSTLLNAAGAALSGSPSNILGFGSSVAESIGSQLASYKGHQSMPNSVVTKAENGGVIHATEMDCYRVYYMRVKPQYAEMIDNYFSCFGYATKRVKVPNVFGRRNWNYVQTIGCTINGNVPSEAETEITKIYDRGVTFWHDPQYIHDYSAMNDII